MPTDVIMPALEMAQETGKVVHWLKRPGDAVRKGEPIVEIETDKVTVEIEAPASGVLRDVTANEGDVVPVGRTIALIVAAGEAAVAAAAAPVMPAASAAATGAIPAAPQAGGSPAGAVKASPLARRIAEQHGVDLGRISTASGRIEKADVLAYVESRKPAAAGNGRAGRLVAASPKARRLAAERGLDLAALRGSGPGGAVLADDVPAASRPAATPARSAPPR
jgi:pyruvate dehydrogenase E2 component (dihydrolipoamide acetyltransferase)